MGTVIVYSKAKVDELTDGAVVGATINVSGELVLNTQDGGTVNVGAIGIVHDDLTGLADDDHPQYALTDGSRGDFATEAQGALADLARPNMEAVIDIQGNASEGRVETITVIDDSTATTGWDDRLVYQFDATDADPRKTFWLNEYGEQRTAPAKHNTTAARFFVKETPTNPSTARDADVPVVELMDNRTDRNSLWGLVGDGTTVVNGLRMAYVLVLDELDSIPAGTPVGTVIVRTS